MDNKKKKPVTVPNIMDRLTFTLHQQANACFLLYKLFCFILL